MSRIRIKRIVWGIAVLIALSFVAAMVLHKHEEPKIIGNLSKEDVLETSRLALNFMRDQMKIHMRYDLKNKEFKAFAETLTLYPRVKVLSVERIGVVAVRVGIGLETNDERATLYEDKIGGAWTLQFGPHTNIAPVSQSGAEAVQKR